MIQPLAAGPLVAEAEFTSLFRAWLGGGGAGLSTAAEQWRRFLTPLPTGPRPAPAWATPAWREPWLADLLADLPDAASRRLCAAQVARLAVGEADVVVTGQQPGFLGGPLYTLYKAAAAVAAAATRSAAGLPTIPLFWCGDDDDDRVEAFSPWLWDPTRRTLLRATPPEGTAGRMVGAAPAAEWGRGELAWLREQARRDGLARELSELWECGLAEGLSWGRLQRRALLRLFRRSGLLAVSGGDAQLHAAAAPLYAELWARREALAQTARADGQALAAAGFHAQLGDGSLARPFHLEEEGRRLSLSQEATRAPAPPEACRLRPGVLLRSAVQDWLFRPAGVVVGPGELAYLVQMQGVYDALGLLRAPLLPRLFALVAPAAQALTAAQAGAPRRGSVDWDAIAGPLAEGSARLLEAALRESAGLDAARARRLADREGSRWRAAIGRLLAREADGERPTPGSLLPPWVHPFGRRQERTLALHWATALWDEEFVSLALDAAGRHFAAGSGEAWHQFVLPVPPLA